ncbi:MAG: aminoacyl-tRNA hydrolase [Lachnospiraceae bacterium]|nr:aminoacyl-tRNA hydrolase [Lachnospiraceae bacterium]
MYIIAGLGNPGLRYRGTRHNAGFEAIDRVAKTYNIRIRKKEKNALTGSGVIEGQKVLLVKPHTYMNKSGEAVGALASYYGVSPEEVIVLVDDVMQDAGGLRIKRSGSAGGHNGLKSLIAHLGTEGFPRVRIGVGKVPPGVDMIGHVLGHIRGEDKKKVAEACGDVPEIIRLLVTGNIDSAMNRYNGKK